jgi:hypothetical protein
MKKLIISVWAVLSPVLCSYAQTDNGAKDYLIETAKYKNGEVAPYAITTTGIKNPKYVVILMPGGNGTLAPKAASDGQGVIFFTNDNFAIRIRNLIADQEFVTAETDSTVAISSLERIESIVADLQSRYPKAKIYFMSTSKGSLSIQELSKAMDGKVAGFINTSSNTIVNRELDTRGLKSRYLLAHHKYDGCKSTTYDGALYNHETYGTELITMDGGTTTGNVCGPMAYHGFLGVEAEVVEKIKSWIKREK